MLEREGTRVLFDQDGEIIAILYRMEGTHVLKRKEITAVNVIDLEYDEFNPETHEITHYDYEQGGVQYRELERYESAEQQRIRELEQQLDALRNE